MYKLKSIHREAITSDVELQVKIAKATKKTIETVKRWARENDSQLTLLSVIDVIKKHRSIPESEIITEQVKENTAA